MYLTLNKFIRTVDFEGSFQLALQPGLFLE